MTDTNHVEPADSSRADFYLESMNRPFPIIVTDEQLANGVDLRRGQMRLSWTAPQDRGMHLLRTYMQWTQDDLPTTTREELRLALGRAVHDICVAALMSDMSARDIVDAIQTALTSTIERMNEVE